MPGAGDKKCIEMEVKDNIELSPFAKYYNSSAKNFAERLEALRNKFRVPSGLFSVETHKEIFQNPPLPLEPAQAFDLLKKYYAQMYCELQIHLFETKYLSCGVVEIKTELQVIQSFIDQALTLNYADAVVDPLNSNRGVSNYHSQAHEYLRLANGFYNNYPLTDFEMSDHSFPSIVYGRYFLFKNWLEKKLSVLQGLNEDIGPSIPTRRQKIIVKGLKSKMSIPVIAPRIGKAPRTVDRDIALMYKAYKCNNHDDLVKIFEDNDWLS